MTGGVLEFSVVYLGRSVCAWKECVITYMYVYIHIYMYGYTHVSVC